MALPTITTTHTDIWVSFWNNTFLPALQTELNGAGGWPGDFTRDGRLVLDGGDASAAQMTGSPSLNIILPDGAQVVVDGVLHTVSGNQTLPVSTSFTGWLQLAASVDAGTGVVTWSVVEHVTRPALGSGVLGKVVSSVDAVTSLDTSEAESDVILSMPVLLERIAASGGEGGPAYWGVLPKSASSAKTIDQAMDEKIALAIAGLGGATPTEQYELGKLLSELGGQGVGLAEVNPDAAKRLQSTLIAIGITGDGSGGSVDDLVEGTATVDSATATIGP